MTFTVQSWGTVSMFYAFFQEVPWSHTCDNYGAGKN